MAILMPKTLVISSIESGRVVKKVDVPDGRYKIEISALNQRSNQQNRYYFGLVIPLIQQGIKHLGTDITKEECHEFLKSKFNSQELVNEETGEFIQIPRSTTALNKEQFGEYISRIQQFASEFLNVAIPDPSTQMTLTYQD